MANRQFYKTKLIPFLLLLSPLHAYGQLEQVTRNLALGKVVDNISLLGLQRTQASVVERELVIQRQKVLNSKDLDVSLQRLKNMQVFHTVKDSYYLDEMGKAHVTLHFSESWTRIPILKATRGGDTSYLVAGVYDVNTGGKYIESGLQYESWDGEDGGVVWFRDPRLMNQRIQFGADLWSVKRPRNLYEPNGMDQGVYILQQQKLNLFLDKELYSGLTVGAGLEFNKDRYIGERMTNLITPGVAEQLADKNYKRTIWAKMYFKIGQLNYHDTSINGEITEISFDYSLPAFDSTEDLYRINLNNIIFWNIGNHIDLGWQFRLAMTNSKELRHLNYAGGFENIRGYFDGQLRGRKVWQSNFEIRNLLYKSNWYHMQGVIFADVAQLYRPDTEVESQTRDIFSSVGIGLRMGTPKIYRFNARMDIAIATSHPATSRVSFGVQQFF